ncbi:Eco57I restriction-modification methylase domain-containing protein [Paraburkholderia sp. SIMBA_054]|uniref:Eco57I restriction-modification methylase domain-containing protein n=1 Tax=Paraburkholderia sp. SIMBA_054 TaxID=3085795 RepID=UPI003979A6D0
MNRDLDLAVIFPEAAAPAVVSGAMQSQLQFYDDEESIRIDAVEKLHFATAIYTASDVVDQLLERLDWPNGTNRLLDPSAGDGMFLVRAIERLFASGVRHVDVCSLIEGWEIHPGACSDARTRVSAVLMQHGYSASDAADAAQRMIVNRDFLADGPIGPYAHTIAGNPPYLRLVNVPQYLRDLYSSVVPDYAKADLLHSFLERCSRAVHPGGRIAFVTSDRWLANANASRLRAALGESLSLVHLERLDSATAFYRPKRRVAGSPPRIHPVSVVMAAGKECGQAISGEPIYPGVDASIYAGLPTLDEVATVRIAPWLGTAGVFVVDAQTARHLPPEYLVPAVDTDDVRDGKLGQPTRWAIRTRPDEEPPKEIMDHLQRNMHRMAARGKQKKLWVPPEPFHSLNLDQESLLVPRIATGPKTVRVPPQHLVLNHNLSVVTAGAASLSEIERAFASPLAMRWVQEHAPRLENGYYSLTTTLVRKMPVVLEQL